MTSISVNLICVNDSCTDKEDQFTSLITLKRNLASYENSSRGNEIDGSEHVDVLIFDLNTIISATDDFSDANKLGEGGFGSVYKVPLRFY